MVSSEDAILTVAAKAIVDSILACTVSDNFQTAVYSAFRSISSFRLCIASLPGNDVLLSSNLLHGGEVMFAPVEAETSCAREVASQCRPAFLTDSTAARCSDLAVISRQETCKAFFCVPLPTNYQPAADGQPSSSTASTESTCLGAIIIGFQTENEVAEHDLRAALLIARHIAVDHYSRLEGLIAAITPVLASGNEPNNHPGWGNAGGLVRSARRATTNGTRRTPPGGGSSANGGGLIRRRTPGGSANIASASATATNQDNSSQISESIDTSDDEDEILQRNNNSSGALILNPVQHALLQSVHPLTLAFPHASLEQQYQDWRNVRMACVDAVAFGTLLAYHITRTSTSRESTPHAGGEENLFLNSVFSPVFLNFTSIARWDHLTCVILVIPLFIVLLPQTHRWYSQRRDTCVTVLYIILAWHHILAASTGASASFFNSTSTSTKSSVAAKVAQQLDQLKKGFSATRAFLNSTALLIEIMSSMDSVWISVLSVILNVRHPWQTIMLVIAATSSLLVAPNVCPNGLSVTACWAVVGARVLCAQMIIPGIALYWLDYGARKAFCATPAASYFAWRFEGARTPRRAGRRRA